MNHFKKRSIALILASVVSVVGAFASNYKNSVMGLSFENTSSGGVNMIVKTRSMYSGNITPIKRDASTYVLMLPEVNSEAPTPNLDMVSGNIQSVSVRTMPYSSGSKGYTRITIKTSNPSLVLNSSNAIYVPSAQNNNQMNGNSSSASRKVDQQRVEEIQRQALERQQERERLAQERQRILQERQRLQQARENQLKMQEQKRSNVARKVENKDTDNTITLSTSVSDLKKKEPEKKSKDGLWLVYAFLIVMLSVLFVMKAKTKMAEIAGETIKFDVDEDKKLEKEKKKKEKQNEENKGRVKKDTTYKNIPSYSNMAEKSSVNVPYVAPVKTVKPAEEYNIVDLDELFKEHQSKSETDVEVETEDSEENLALEDFLSGFSFDEEFNDFFEKEEEEKRLKEELYQEIINNKDIKFTKDDLVCINKLLDIEINDDTLNNIKKYAVSNPIKIKPSKKEILEEIVTSYAISQNILFSSEEINTINKLISIEIDPDFVTDLRTNPIKTSEMEKQIAKFNEKLKRPSEIITLKVKDILPDLSEALKQQGGKRIESSSRAETVYYQEGYEVNKLNIKDLLPDLSKEINKPSSYTSKPSADWDLSDNSYEVKTLKTTTDLPDLQDALNNPEKYKSEEPVKEVASVESLLNNISNVQFKPFYTEAENISENIVVDVPSNVNNDVEEFKELFDDKDAVNNEVKENNIVNSNQDDSVLEEICVSEPIEIKQEVVEPKQVNTNNIKNIEEVKEIKEVKNVKNHALTRSQALIKKIEQSKLDKMSKYKKEIPTVTKKTVQNLSVKPELVKKDCKINGETYTILSTSNITEKIGCHLAKKDGKYFVLSFVGKNIKELISYDSLKSEKIQARLQEKISETESKYLVRIGLKKFIINFKNNDIEFLMELS